MAGRWHPGLIVDGFAGSKTISSIESQKVAA
jgi:hypothetical protein